MKDNKGNTIKESTLVKYTDISVPEPYSNELFFDRI